LTGPIAILSLRVSGQSLAIAQTEVIEVLPVPRLATVPEAPEMVTGAFRLGAETVLVIRLATLLGLTAQPEGDALYHHLLLLPARDGAARLALLVDRVTNLHRIEPTLLPAGHSFNDCVTGDVQIDGAVVPLLAVARLLTAKDLAFAEAFALRAEARGV
jgi:chemotaxis signal transduction protein